MWFGYAMLVVIALMIVGSIVFAIKPPAEYTEMQNRPIIPSSSEGRHTAHGTHAILTIATGGTWAAVWAWRAAKNNNVK